MILTKEQQKKCVQALIQAGEVDLGFCKLNKVIVKGGKGRSLNTTFKRQPFIKLWATMSDETKEKLFTDSL